MSSFDETRGTNGLGIAGFVVSLVGFCGTGGLLSPIGLVLSLFALRNKPRGFAIAGTVIGAIGTCGGLLALIIGVTAIAIGLAAAGATGLALTLSQIGGPQLESQVEMTAISVNIQQHRKEHGDVYPATLGEGTTRIAADSTLLKDHWDRPYLYEVSTDRKSYWLYSAGPDGVPNNADDIEFLITRENYGERPGALPPTAPSDPPGSETETESAPPSEPERPSPGDPA